MWTNVPGQDFCSGVLNGNHDVGGALGIAYMHLPAGIVFMNGNSLAVNSVTLAHEMAHTFGMREWDDFEWHRDQCDSGIHCAMDAHVATYDQVIYNAVVGTSLVPPNPSALFCFTCRGDLNSLIRGKTFSGNID